MTLPCQQTCPLPVLLLIRRADEEEKRETYFVLHPGCRFWFPLRWALHARPRQPFVRKGSRGPQATSPPGSAGPFQLGGSSSSSQLSCGKQSIWGIQVLPVPWPSELTPSTPTGNWTPQHPTPDHCFSAFASPLRGPRPPSSGQGAQRRAPQSLRQAALWPQASFSP